MQDRLAGKHAGWLEKDWRTCRQGRLAGMQAG
jgi:hypothetical protein